MRKGKRVSIKELEARIPDNFWQKTAQVYKTMEDKNERQEQYFVSKIINMQQVEKVKKVFTRAFLEEDIVLFVGTNRLDLYAQDILEIYAQLWSIEIFFRDFK